MDDNAAHNKGKPADGGADMLLLDASAAMRGCFSAWIGRRSAAAPRFILSDAPVTGAAWDDSAPTYPQNLTRLLHQRFKSGLGGCAHLPFYQAAHNGALLQEAVLKEAVHLRLGGGFIEWLMNENAFCTTLWDDMTSDAGRWVIQAPGDVFNAFMACAPGFPAVLMAEIAPLQARKSLLLDAAEATLSPAWTLCDLLSPEDGMADGDGRAFAARLLTSELAPLVPGDHTDALQYTALVCRRFERGGGQKPFNAAANGEKGSDAMDFAPSKFAAHALPALYNYAKMKQALPPCLCYGLSALVMCCAGIAPGDQGEYIALWGGAPRAVLASPYALEAFSRLNCDMPPETLAYAALSDRELWGADLREIPGLEDAVAGQLRDMQLLGARQAMRMAAQAHESA